MSSSQTSALTQEPEESIGAASVPDMSNTESTELAAIPKVKHAPFQSLPTLRGEITEEQLKDPGEIFRKEQAKKYFSLRNGAFTNAVEECKSCLDEHDGELVGGWLLSEIDHWDHEKERIILITKKALCIVKYNFIGLKVDEVKKIPLIQCDKIQIGRFVYPKNTMMMVTSYGNNSSHSKQSGVRICYSRQQPSFFQRWNPLSDEMPYITLTSHIQSALVDSPPEIVQHGVFSRALIQAITEAREAEHNQDALSSFEVVETDLQIDVYLGLSALVFNQSKLGFCKDRGNVFF
ncbi:tumor protein p63-regulated gene 1-like protein isoform X1 [Acropora millepora]|uniref:tumor protein p63-regulated gene 1-like protein isoform X1 n=1 Tax=Acropora millepora TaxID=45264 RepID=UPI001CF56783|nr:tumor protein p63-regulated gene 1-like protein isoform X1 [Acropora millepora]